VRVCCTPFILLTFPFITCISTPAVQVTEFPALVAEPEREGKGMDTKTLTHLITEIKDKNPFLFSFSLFVFLLGFLPFALLIIFFCMYLQKVHTEIKGLDLEGMRRLPQQGQG